MSDRDIAALVLRLQATQKATDLPRKSIFPIGYSDRDVIEKMMVDIELIKECFIKIFEVRNDK